MLLPEFLATQLPSSPTLFCPSLVFFYLLLTSILSLLPPLNPHNHPSLWFRLHFLETHFSLFLSTDIELNSQSPSYHLHLSLSATVSLVIY